MGDRDRESIEAAALWRSKVKWLSLAETKGPNAEFQRFIGQCALAATAGSATATVDRKLAFLIPLGTGVDQKSASWNRPAYWLAQLEALRKAP